MNRMQAMTYLPAYKGDKKLKVSNGENRDIIEVWEESVPLAIEQTKALAESFRAPTKEQECRKMWDFLRKNVRYKADDDNQIIKLPNALMAEGEGDCKSYTLFAVSVLYNLGHTPVGRFVSYDNLPIPRHVYAVSDRITVDGTVGEYNQESSHTYRLDYIIKPMEVYTVTGPNGVGGNPFKWLGDQIGDVFEKVSDVAEDAFNGVKVVVGQVFNGVKTVGLSPARAAFLELIRLNVFGLASSLAKKKQSSLETWWKGYGGTASKIVSAVNEGKTRQRIMGASSMYGGDLITYGGIAADPVTLIATAAPIAIGVWKFIKNDPNADGSYTGDEDIDGLVNLADQARDLYQKKNGKKPEDEVYDVQDGADDSPDKVTSGTVTSTSATATLPTSWGTTFNPSAGATAVDAQAPIEVDDSVVLYDQSSNSKSNNWLLYAAGALLAAKVLKII